MPRSNRTFRVFVSSTFADLKAERSALQERVFPALRDLCLRYGCRFQAIDLRWGVSQEASLDQRTLPICLEEVARCQATTPRPNFVLLLGDRYGWRPLPYEIPAAEFDQLKARITDPNALTLLSRYRLDQNARSPVYVLLPREGALEDPETWEYEVERPLRRALELAAEACGLPAEAQLKYRASATEQEIEAGALQATDPRRHVFGFLRAIEGLPLDSAAADFRDVDRNGAPDEDAAARLGALKRRLHGLLGPNLKHYRARWTGRDASTDHIDALCRDMLARLSAVIRKEIARLGVEDDLERERMAHAAFGAERARHFTGREGELSHIAEYLRDSSPQPLVIWGDGGSGKSALLSEAARRAAEQHPAAAIITRFVGATPASADGGGLLASVCEDIAHAYRGGATGSTDFRLLVQEFPRRLAVGRRDRPLVLFLDALDQLASPEEVGELDWLPTRLPAHAKLIVSVANGESLERLRERLPDDRFHPIPPMSLPEGQRLLNGWLEDAGRDLTPAQHREVHARFLDSPLPIYLKLAFEEVRRWRSFDGISPLGNGVPGIVGTLFARLAAGANHGGVLTRKALAYLLGGRHGLTEDELLEVLSEDGSVLEAFRQRNPRSPPVTRLPVVVWSRLYYDLEPYLTERQADGTRVIGFYHRQVAEAFARDHVGPASLGEAHQALAAYFARQPHWLRSESRVAHRRKASELPWQQLSGALLGNLTDLATTLTELEFVEMKCAAGSAWDLVGDYERAWSNPDDGPSRVRAFRRFLTAHASIFERDASQVIPFAWNYAADGPVTRAAEAVVERIGWETRPWIELRDRPPWIERPALESTLAGHEGAVLAVGLSSDGSLAVSGGEDDTIRVWDTRRALCRQVIPAGQGGVHAIAVARDGKIAASGGADGTIKTWDLKSASCLRGFTGHEGIVRRLAMTQHGSLASAGEDGLVKLWDGEQPEPVVFAGHFGPVHAVATTADESTVISGGEDRVIRVWDAQQGRTTVVLKGHATPVQGVAIDPSGSVIASCSGQVPDAGGIVPYALLQGSEIGFWNLEGDGGPVGTCHDIGDRGGRTAGVLASVVHAVALSGSARVAVSGGYDGAVGVWHVASRQPERLFFGHAGAVLDVALDHAGDLAASASADGTVRLWSLEGRALPRLPTVRDVGRIGRGARAGTFERMGLVWRNARIRRWLVIPAAAAALGLVVAGPLGRLAPQLGGQMGITNLSVAIAALTVGLMVEWRLVLKGDPHIWKRPVVPGLMRAVLGMALLPILPWFRVLHCPVCGSRIAGRRRLLHCSTCGFRDRSLLPSRRR